MCRYRSLRRPTMLRRWHFVMRCEPMLSFARSYSELKTRLAQRFPNDRESYILGKTEFVLEVLAKANVRALATGERTT